MNKLILIAILGLFLVAAQECKQGSIMINDLCTEVNYIEGCVQYSSSEACSICAYNYRISGSGCSYTQKPVTDCCVLVDEQNKCSQCAPGLYLDGNSCFKLVKHGCLEGKGLVCSNCAKGFTNIDGKCIKQIDGCINYSNLGQCQGCDNGYLFQNGICSKSLEYPLVSNCQTTNVYGCVVCQDGFHLTKSKTCQINKVGCLIYYKQVCQMCTSEFKLVQGFCKMEGCTENSGDECSKCQPPFILNKGQCLINNCIESSNEECITCAGDYRVKNGKCVLKQKDCASCGDGYLIGDNGKCFKKIANCAIYNADGACAICNDPFAIQNLICNIAGCMTLDDTGCTKCNGKLQVSNKKCAIKYCSIHDFQTGNCKQCVINYHLQSNLCVINSVNCLFYADSGSCQTCNDGFTSNQFGICVQRLQGCMYQDGRCISCASPFKKVSDSPLVCAIDGCSTYNSNVCTLCKEPFQKNNHGGCTINNCAIVTTQGCDKCSQGYVKSYKGGCMIAVSKCQKYENDVCVLCANNLVISNQNTCVSKINNCLTQSIGGCVQCISGYQVSGTSCVIIDINCINYDKNLYGCTKCAAGLHSEFGVCKADNPLCAAYNLLAGITQNCAKCANGYVFSKSGSCIKKNPGCVYDLSGICSSCTSPFKYNTLNSNCFIDMCADYTEFGCKNCKYPSLVSDKICVIPFCATYDYTLSLCLTCQNGYQQIQGKCSINNPRCVDYSKDGICKSCIKQYIIFQDTCVKEDKNCKIYSRNGGCNECKDIYYKSVDSICLPKDPGCIYSSGECTNCNYPFIMNTQANKCRINACLQANSKGCTKCRDPFVLTSSHQCEIPNCQKAIQNRCQTCSIGYHLKQGLYCSKDSIGCVGYNKDGDCLQCLTGYLIMSNGDCELAEDKCISRSVTNGKCVTCKPEYFLNRYFQCQVRDPSCEEYNNGICVKCLNRFFLYSEICFPYSKGCVTYDGKDCIRCKTGYTLGKGECITLKSLGLQVEGMNDKYDFDITPIDIRKSKYDISNLSPISKLGTLYYSSFFNSQYNDPRLIDENATPSYDNKGWKAENAREGEFIGYSLGDTEPVTFYAIQLEGVEGNYIKEFFLEYSVDGTNFVRVQTAYNAEKSKKNITTIYFTAIYAKSIRIVIKNFFGWPQSRFEVFYYDSLRFKKISNLRSLTYLKESIQSNFVDRMDNQFYINNRAFFAPNTKSCASKDVCFTGIELCQPRTINSLVISVKPNTGILKKVQITYSLDGINFIPYGRGSDSKKYSSIVLDQNLQSNLVILNNLLAKNIRVRPVQYTDTPNMQVTYDYI